MAKVARAGLTFSATDLPPGLSIASSGKISGKIDANASRAYPVVIRAEDANGKSATDTFSWLISNETSVAGNVSGSGGNKAKFKQLTDPKNGSVALNGDGSFTYTPNPGFNGTDKFYYKTVNANGAVSPATVTIDINRVNETNSAAPDTNSNSFVSEAGIAINGGYGTGQINTDGSHTYALDASKSNFEKLDAGET